MDIGRDAAAVIAHRHRTIAVEDQLNRGGKPGLHLINRVVDDLERHVMQARAVIGVTDIHARSFTDRIKTAQHGDR